MQLNPEKVSLNKFFVEDFLFVRIVFIARNYEKKLIDSFRRRIDFDMCTWGRAWRKMLLWKHCWNGKAIKLSAKKEKWIRWMWLDVNFVMKQAQRRCDQSASIVFRAKVSVEAIPMNLYCIALHSHFLGLNFNFRLLLAPPKTVANSRFLTSVFLCAETLNFSLLRRSTIVGKYFTLKCG